MLLLFKSSEVSPGLKPAWSSCGADDIAASGYIYRGVFRLSGGHEIFKRLGRCLISVIPDLLRLKSGKHGNKPTDMVGVGMCGYDYFEFPST
jgi:hypothetical protein